MLFHNLTAGMRPCRLRSFMVEKRLSIMCRDVDAAGGDNPDDIVHAYWWQHHQPRDAWTFKRDLRPAPVQC